MVKEIGGVSGVNMPQNNTPAKTENNDKIVIDFNQSKDTTSIVIEKGMTLSELALQYNTTVEDIMQLNGLSKQDDIRAGQALKIPTNTASETQQLQRAHNKRMEAERKELKDKGITTPQDKAKHFMQKDLESGHLEYVPPKKFLGLKYGGDYYKYEPYEPYIETYGELKERYNLPDGTIKDINYIPGGGNLDERGIDFRVKIPRTYLESGM